MHVSVYRGDLASTRADLLVLNLFSDVKEPGGATNALDRALGGLITKLIHEEEFQGKEGHSLLFRTLGKIPARWVLVVGLGDRRRFGLETVRRAAGFSVRKAKEIGAREIKSVLHGAGVGGLAARGLARAMTEGALLANYRFTKFKREDAEREKKRGLRSFIIVEQNQTKVGQAEKGIREGVVEAGGVLYARELVNEPALHMTPSSLAARARDIATASRGKIKIKIHDKAALAKMGAGGIIAVGQGSDHPPVLVHLTWKPARAKCRIALVGKAITFDSGGLSLKPSDAMVTMKCDMAGAAAVLGVFSVLTALNPRIEIHGIFAACENMPSGTAIRPGDIVRTMNGKTIEILNTDAEGRVTLADSLHYACRLKPDYVIDLATLTGACVVALGELLAGLMTNDSRLGTKLKMAAGESGEYIWELPLPREYRELILSKFADVKNITGSRWGGALTAGLFLKEFVGEVPWAHLDIAGPAFAEQEVIPYVPLGGTGFGVRTLIHFLQNL
ncbi:leucyl aminopeptidase [Candidatus Uhrbacteria bacterium]|nr:leucyl aminopeptidase [Candidatus Uhrbacteria bacterium]